MENLIDIGVNLTARCFTKDFDGVVSRAQRAGVSKMIVTGTDIAHSEQAADLAQKNPGVLYATAGVHPHHASDCDDRTLAILETLASQQGVVAIGECGLDFNRNFSPAEAQEKWFEAQLELASGLNMPVFLHQRDAHPRFIEIVSRWRDKLVAAVAHCFTGTVDEVLAYGDLDLHIGVTGWVCDERRGQSLQQAVSHIPVDRLMIETDAPYLLPRDLAEKPKDNRNEPMFLPHVCVAVAKYRHESADLLAKSTAEVSKRFFSLRD